MGIFTNLETQNLFFFDNFCYFVLYALKYNFTFKLKNFPSIYKNIACDLFIISFENNLIHLSFFFKQKNSIEKNNKVEHYSRGSQYKTDTISGI